MIRDKDKTHKALCVRLAQAYRILGKLGMDDLTYTHLSARVPGENAFYIYPFGLLFEEVRPELLLYVNFDGEILEGEEKQYNLTGYMIHGAVYRARSDLNAVFHLHTTASIAVSVNKAGLLPLSQFALHFYDRIAYHDYGSLVLNHQQGDELSRSLGEHKVMLLRNHGLLTCGRTIEEAFFYTYHLEQACKVQCAASPNAEDLVLIDPAVREKACRDLLGFEKNLGKRDFEAMVRTLG
jgi:ribulose-5-phosphate 4-epimerase/fuculose-1-phosphate aldolase